MPRYLNRETDQFWEITIERNVVHTRFGAIGTDGDESHKTLPDETRARAEHDRLIATKLERGFDLDDGRKRKPKVAAPVEDGPRPARNPELEKQIAKDLDDRDAYLVYADWLSDHGDPRGELIALQAKPKHEKAAANLINAHREHFLGDLHELSERTLRVTWRLGFIDTVHLQKDDGADDDDRSTGEQLRVLLQHPSSAFVRELSFGTVDGIESSDVHYDSILTTLGELRPRFVESVKLGVFEEFEVSWTHAGDVTGLWALPKLRKASIRAGSMSLGEIEARELRELEIITGGLDAESIRSIANAQLERLDKLIIYFGSSRYGATGSVRDLAKLLAGKGVPALTHLGLMNAEFTDEICAALGRSKLVRQIAVLDLSKGTMTETGVAALLAHREAFAHLRELHVGKNCLSSADLRQLKGLCKRIISDGGQKGAGERYVSLGE